MENDSIDSHNDYFYYENMTGTYLASRIKGVCGHFASMFILTYFDSLLPSVKITNDVKRRNTSHLKQHQFKN